MKSNKIIIALLVLAFIASSLCSCAADEELEKYKKYDTLV